MERQTHRRGNKNGMIEIDDTNRGDSDVEFKDTEMNRILGTDLLVIHLIKKANLEKNKYRRIKHLNDIVYLYSILDKVLMNCMNHLLGKAYVSMLEEYSLCDVDLKFANMLLESLRYIPYKCGRSVVEFNESECKRNAIEYRNILRSKSLKHYIIRTKLSYCLLQLGQIEEAEVGFELALKSNSNFRLALVGLALTKLINHKSPISINLFVNLSKELTVNTINGETIIKIALNYFYEHKYKKAAQYLNIVLQKSRNVDLIAESFDLLGRIYEKKGDYHRAFEYYFRAVYLKPYVIGHSHMGLGKMYTMHCSFDKAQQFLEMYLHGFPNCIKTKKMLSTMFIHSEDLNKKQRAEAYLLEITNKFPDCMEAWVGFATLSLENHELLTRIYRKIADLMRNFVTSKCPIEVLIDLSYIHLQFENYEVSCVLLEKSLEYLKDNSKSTSCLYNTYLTRIAKVRLADAYARHNKLQKAYETYKEIVRMDPNDIDTMTNLGSLALFHEREEEAREYTEKALQLNPRSPDALELLKKLNLKNGFDVPELNESSLTDVLTTFIQLKKFTKQNINNMTANKDDEFNSLALELFKKLLYADPKIIWDTSGLGHNIANDCAMMSKLKYTFGNAQNSGTLCKSWIFYADTCTEGNHSIKTKILETCMKLFFIHDSLKIYAMLGFQYSQSENFKDCKKMLLKALMVAPDDLSIRNNFAFALHKVSTEVLEDEGSSPEDVHRAITDIKLAEKFFIFLVSQNDVKVHGGALEGLLSCRRKLDSLLFNKTRDRASATGSHLILKGEPEKIHIQQVEDQVEVRQLFKNQRKRRLSR